jgi:DNA polymerase
VITLDFETRGVVDLTKVGAMRYAMDRATQALCLCWNFSERPIEEVELWHRDHPWIEKSPRPDELIERIRDGEPIEAHNAGFEFYTWNETLRREFPEFDVEIKLEQLYCSAAKGSCVSMPRRLGDAAAAAGLDQRKDTDGRRLITKLSKPRRRTIRVVDPELIALGFTKKDATTITTVMEFCEEEAEHRKNWLYCGQDVRTERSYSEWLPEMSEREREYWVMDFRMNQRGITLDLDAARIALDMAKVEADRLNKELHSFTGIEKGSQRIPLRKWINGRLQAISGGEITGLPDMQANTLSMALYGVPTKAGEEAKEAARPGREKVWEDIGPNGVEVKRAMEICLEVNRSSTAKFRAMLNSVCPDGRLHDIMLYNGADRTGRWSGKGVQPHNFVRGHSKDMGEAWDDILALDREFITMMWGEPLVHLSKAARGALIASPGCELYAADFNAIEARKLAWLSGCAPLLTLFQTGGDPYITMAEAIYKRPLNKKDNPTERQLGKKAILGLGYAMGWEKFQATVWAEEGIWLEDEFCQMIVKIYRKEMYPEIPALWKATNDTAIAAVEQGGEHYCGGDEFGQGAVSYFVEGRFLHCRLPSGRLLAYLDPEVHTKVNWRFKALNANGKPTVVMFPSRQGVPLRKARYHAERLAGKQKKTLLNEAPKTFLSPHLSFMGRDTFTRKWKRCGTHGGTLVENYDQASSRDLLAEAMYRVDQRDEFDLLLSIHDEVIAEAPIGTATLKEFENIMSEVPKWAPGMPITAEGWIGPRLRK